MELVQLLRVSETRHGRAPLTAAGYGPKKTIKTVSSLPERTPVARTARRSTVCCCRSSVALRVQQVASHWPRLHSFSVLTRTADLLRRPAASFPATLESKRWCRTPPTTFSSGRINSPTLTLTLAFRRTLMKEDGRAKQTCSPICSYDLNHSQLIHH